MSLSVDLHVHSCLSPCADEDMTPHSIAGMAYLNGLRLVALTDHNSAKNCPAFLAACREFGIAGVAGMELTTAEDIHLVCLFGRLERALAFDEAIQPKRMRIKNRVEIYGSQRILDAEDNELGSDPYFLPAATTLDLSSAAALVKTFDGVCYPAHIDREANGLLAVLGAFPQEPAFSVCELHDAARTDLAEGRRIVVSSDAHRLWELKEADNVLPLPDAGTPEGRITALFEYLGRPL